MFKDKAMELVKALRSGKYKQGVGNLRSNGKYCCLGVACEISGLSKFKSTPIGVDADSYLQCRGALPEEVRDYYDFRNHCGEYNPTLAKQVKSFDPNITTGALTTLNDSGATFEQIADFIELNWEIL